MIELRTWNVLHRIHAENWREPTIANLPDESERMRRIAAAIGTPNGPTAICLQEVSGDQLAILRSTLSGTVFEATYPRVPKLRDPAAAAVLTDPREHLVVIVFGANAKLVSTGSFRTDPGKGWLAVEVDGIVVVDTHVTYGERRVEQCARLLELAPPSAPCVVLGDFNADRATCAGLLPGFSPAIQAEPALATRPRAVPSEKSQTIDHVFGRGVTFATARVEDGRGLSDHNPVVAVLS